MWGLGLKVWDLGFKFRQTEGLKIGSRGLAWGSIWIFYRIWVSEFRSLGFPSLNLRLSLDSGGWFSFCRNVFRWLYIWALDFGMPSCWVLSMPGLNRIRVSRFRITET